MLVIVHRGVLVQIVGHIGVWEGRVPDRVMLDVVASQVYKVPTSGLIYEFEIVHTPEVVRVEHRAAEGICVHIADLPGHYPLLPHDLKVVVPGIVHGEVQGERGVLRALHLIDEAGVEYDLDAIPRDAALLRQALMQTGRVDQAKLDSLTDDERLRFFDEAKAEIIANNPALNSTTGTKQNP